MNNERKPGPNQYLDRNGNIRTRAIRHTLAQIKLEEKLDRKAKKI